MTLCHRPQRRIIVPGIKTDTGQTSVGQPVYDEQRRVWIVIRTADERPVTAGGYSKRAESHLLTTDYCKTKAQAIAVCRTLHARGCTLRGCEWKDAPEPEPEKKQTITRYFHGWMPTP